MSMRYVHPVISLVDAPRAHAASTSRIRLTAAIVAMIVLAFGILTTAANPANATTTDYVYWTNVNSNAIGRANIDGTAPDQNFITGANAPDGVTATSTHIYWTNVNNGTIGRANIDGTGANQNFITGANLPFGVTATSTHVYWANRTNNTIGRANIDGTGTNQNFITGANTPNGVAANATHLYWTNYGSNTIGRANIDGTSTNQNFITGANGPVGLAATSTHLYWTNGNNTIGRANIDGTSADQTFVTGANLPVGLAATSTHIYWSNLNFGTIGRANIDGTGTNQNFITGANGPVGVATAPVTPEPTPVPGTTTVPANGCVTAGSATSIPRTGTKRLMKPKCVTNSGAQIGVKASAQRRGDMRTYTLFCKTTNGKTSKTSATGNAGTRYCKKGALNIRTYGVKLNLRITWKAPVVGDYAAYTKVKSYRT